MQLLAKKNIFSSLILTILAIIFALPNFTNSVPAWLPQNSVNLGLDLRGGSHLLFNVNFASYYQDLNNSILDSLRKNLREQKIFYTKLTLSKDKSKIELELRHSNDYINLAKLVRKIEPNLSYSKDNNGKISLFFNEYALNQLQDQVIDQSIEVIRMRIDGSGVKEPIIQRQGVDNILVQVPGASSPLELKQLIGKTAKLSLHLVDEVASANYRQHNSIIPSDAKLVSYLDTTTHPTPLIIKKKKIISGEQINNAQAQFQDGFPVVSFSLNHFGAKKFAEVTKNHRGTRLAIILDEKILSSPAINVPILDGSGIISGNFTIQSATELALMLRAGALPAELKIVEERTIGPNLGADSIEAGQIAALTGFGLVVCFMFLFYGMLGLIANISLIIALLYILASLSLLQATLTLPGIAGIILTIGMAVDANVLIYERIREEINKGSSNLYAVKIGFNSAFGTILDSNITTLIAAFLLYSFGVGTIKGFAVTLTIGIIASMYTALVVTKLLIDLWLNYYKPKSLGL